MRLSIGFQKNRLVLINPLLCFNEPDSLKDFNSRQALCKFMVCFAPMKEKYRVLGLMSGTSLDGVDLALCNFTREGKKWNFKVESAKTFPYNNEWRKLLSSAHLLSGRDLSEWHARYGKWLGTLCKKYLKESGRKQPDFISSHGHTIFHQPSAGFTFQLGDGTAIAASCGLPVICDFRSLDVQLGGQGAPLVPIGDKLLFHQYDVCVNLGGIANLSFDKSKRRLAWDICFVNMGLNLLAARAGKRFDEGGKIAGKGAVDPILLNALLNLPEKIGDNHPSLAREHFEKFVEPLFIKEKKVQDLMRTFCEYAAISVVLAIKVAKAQTVLLTGGGAHNNFLVERMRIHAGSDVKIECGSRQIIDFKEAIIFAFLGVLKKEGKINCLRSVTGASRDSSGGVMIGF